MVLGNFSLCKVGIHTHALAKHVGIGSGVVQQQVEHDDIGSHLHKVTGAKVVEGLVGRFLHVGHSLLKLVGHSLGTCLYALQFLAHFGLLKLTHLCQVRAIGHIAYGCHHLQLRGALVDRGDAGIAVVALNGILHHKARTAVNLNGVVGVLVAVLRVHALGQRGE